MPNHQRVTIFLLDGIETFEQSLDKDQVPASTALHTEFGLDGVFYWKFRPANTPAWVQYVAPALVDVPSQLRSSSASGLLVLKAAGRFFALTFGYGRSMLDATKIVRQFGLKVALNTIDPAHIRSLDTKTFEDMVLARNTQASRSTQLPTFGIDTMRDILRAVTGEPRDSRFGKRISGADPIVLNIEADIGTLGSLCIELLDAYRGSSYRTNFGWVDDLALVENRETLNSLDEALVGQLRDGETAYTHLSMPDPLDWGEVDAFKITGTKKHEYDDLDIDDYLTHLGAGRADITVDLLKGRKVQVRFTRSPDWDSRWTLYQCLVSEQRIGGGLYVLIEGRWFEVSQTLAERVDTFASSLGSAPFPLISSSRGETEPDYNKRLTQAFPGGRLCLDARIVKPEGATSGIELCDVLALDGTLVHVKRKSRSSTLSHLFAQGVVSATTLLNDGEFRSRVRGEIEKQAGGSAGLWSKVIPDRGEEAVGSQFRVSYVVIANSSRAGSDWLPFFSKLNLMQAAQALRSLGVEVTLDRVAAP
jgi:uncharacterized protein (TIGR04141 family)